MFRIVGGRTEQEIREIERDLKLLGFQQVHQSEKLEKNNYKVNSYFGRADSFDGEQKFTIEWHE